MPPAARPLAPALAVSAYTLVTALGSGRKATLEALQAGRSGLARRRFQTAARPTREAGPRGAAEPDRPVSADFDAWLGVVDAIDAAPLPAALAAFECRNNRLAALGLVADGFDARVLDAAARYGPSRVGVFLGTSTSGILATELAYRERDPSTGALPGWLDYARTHNTYSVARFVRTALGLAGPAQAVSTACSSSAKVFATAARLIEAGIVDAAVVGGVDTLCLTTLYGFRALELVSPEICRPWDAERQGLALGEGAAFALLERRPQQVHALLLGTGESSDGYHMSAPHPEGAGAAAAMRGALEAAGLTPAQVDYLNLHGTATPNNDAAEDRAVVSVFGRDLACSSTKGYTGHALGASGGVEAAIAMLAIEHGWLPPTLNLTRRDPALQLEPLVEARRMRVHVAASNSFGFGGSNACLVFGAAS